MSGASSYSGLVDQAFWFILGSSVILLLGITAVLIYFIMKYSRANNPKPAQIEGSKRLELLWTILPTILVMVMFYYGWAGFKVMRDIPEDAMEVVVNARMWSWSFEYPNGVQSSELYVPTGKPISLKLRSSDVIHSFFVPDFRLKEDCMPGRENKAWFETVRDGEFTIFCAEYCGEQHSQMLSKVVSVPPVEFDDWLKKNTGPISPEKLLSIKGCVACHTSDGTPLVGPSYKGLLGRTETVLTDGELREIVVDEEYIRKSILDPNADLVEGFSALMPPMKGQITDEEINTLIEYFKTLK
ncbi:MAG: cytochrome c oxidase subunit II [bacterium]|nr:cytochrome c oxidase subunit II [bacterium]